MGLLSRKRLLSWLFILLVVAVALNAYIWYQAKERMDEFASMMRPFAQISYEGIIPSLLGQVSIRGVEIRPLGINDEVRIDRVTLSAGNLLELIRLERDLQALRLPKALGVSAEGVRFHTQGDILHGLQEMQAADGQTASVDAAFGSCGDGTVLGPDDWHAMGYQSLVADLHYAYEHDQRFDSVTFSGNTRVREAAEVRWEIRLTSMPLGEITPVRLMNQQPRVEHMNFKYTDLSYNQRRNRYCADRSEMEVGAFIEQHVSAIHTLMNQTGLEPSESLVDAYRRFVTNAGSIEVQAFPSSSLNFTNTRFYGPQELVDALGIRLHVNDEPVRDVALRRYRPEAGADVPQAVADPSSGADRARPERAGRAAPQYREVDFSDLEQHLHRSARAYLSNGRQREGLLVEVEPDRLVLRRRMHGGDVSFPLTFAELERVEVFH
ncbi:MAG: hypothetical protein JJU06_21000 [Ectothiorhodospiraceae bacterium]|nr:hypothetical protein [Ectothiorhodospiraceae bacterium]MCH8506380.1 hypothetical protein [Ectothiorhodospiraceae bacterium]